jgi:hypothetical protein
MTQASIGKSSQVSVHAAALTLALCTANAANVHHHQQTKGSTGETRTDTAAPCMRFIFCVALLFSNMLHTIGYLTDWLYAHYLGKEGANKGADGRGAGWMEEGAENRMGGRRREGVLGEWTFCYA